MSDGTNIEWTTTKHPDGTVTKGATWNIITGCSVVSAGCKHCYAMKLAGTRLRNDPSRRGLTIDTKAGPVWNGEVRFNEKWLRQPLEWKRGRKIFVCAHGDLFHENVPDEWLDKVFAVMALAEQHTFQVLTKRPDRMLAYISDMSQRRRDGRGMAVSALDPECPLETLRWPLPNVWLGVSVEDQAAANDRIPPLMETPAAVRFLSCEPLLGPVDLTRIEAIPDSLDERGRLKKCGIRINALTGTYFESGAKYPESRIHWVIAGGESGHDARPMHPSWVTWLRDQCADGGAAFFFKQWGAWAPNETHPERMFVYADGSTDIPDMRVAALENNGETEMARIGKKAAGRLLDGQLHDEFPRERA